MKVVPRIVAYSRTNLQRYRAKRLYNSRNQVSNSVPQEDLATLVEKLKRGIQFEQKKGLQNWPGQNQIFSDFLSDALDAVLRHRGLGDRESFLRLSELVKKSKSYSQMTGEMRMSVLSDVEKMLCHIEQGSGISVGYDGMECTPFVFDLEATGLSTKTSHVVEIAAANMVTQESFVSRVRLPDGASIHPDVEKLTGLQSDDFRDACVPSFEQAVSEFFSFIQTACNKRPASVPLLIGHNIVSYDVRLLHNRLQASGMEREQRFLLEECLFLDTLKLSRDLLDDAESYKLGYLYNYLTGKQPENAHRALGDVHLTMEVVNGIMQRMNIDDLRQGRASDLLKPYIITSEVIKFSHKSEKTAMALKEEARPKKDVGAMLTRDDILNLDVAGDLVATEPEPDPLLSDIFEDKRAIRLQTPVKEMSKVFSTADKKLLTQMECSTLKDVLYLFPRGYLAASIGKFPQSDIEVDQAIVLPVYMEKVKVFRGKFHILNASMRCLDHDMVMAGKPWEGKETNPVIEYKAFRRGRSAGWAIANEEKRLKAMGNFFAVSAQVTVSDAGTFVIKEKTLDFMSLDSYVKLPKSDIFLRAMYPQKARISAQSVSDIVSKALGAVKQATSRLLEPLPSNIRQKYSIGRLYDSIQEIHRPSSIAQFVHARTSIAFHELFFMQLRLLCRSKVSDGDYFEPMSNFEQQALATKALKFPLTNDQERALKAINTLFSTTHSSSILLQGDVGCGKTIVALLAALAVVGDGKQVAIMAPTEVLAEQHLRSFEHLVTEASKIPGFTQPKYALLTGSTKTAERKAILNQLESGEIDVLIGTHALLSGPVIFKDLAFAVVDEQHKFGVEQRASLLSKANPAPHMLNMSATPIPRSLALVLYGEMECIEIQEMPPGRIPVKTSVWTETSTTRDDLIHTMKREIDSGGKCFVVCPLIDADAENGVRSVLNEKERLSATKELPSDAIGILHGKMTGPEKDEVLTHFLDGHLQILISTTVVEVGVNIPDASLIIVEHAERFGLAQLHQLRGRVGRGTRASQCILVTEGDAERLRILEDTASGFKVAEADLHSRGSGDMIGTAQAGQGTLNSHRLWELPRDAHLVTQARTAAQDFITQYGSDVHAWPQHASQALDDLSGVNLDINELPNFTLQ